MPAWLGCALAGMFMAVALHRIGGRDAPAALMSVGMAAMAVGMGGIGPNLVHGQWWAAGFAALSLWSASTLVRRPRPVTGRLLHGHLPHLVGGAAMIYMCMAGVAYETPVTVTSVVFQVPGGHHHGSSDLYVAGLSNGHGGLGPSLFVLAGWLLAVYFVFASVCVLTSRRGVDGPPARRDAVVEAAMGLGTMVMLVSMI
jgi:hypothetical protein